MIGNVYVNKTDRITFDVNFIEYKQDSIDYHKQINDSLIEKYKSIRYMTCMKSSK